MPRKKFIVNVLTNDDGHRSNNPVVSHLTLFVRRLIKTKSVTQLQEEATSDNSFKRTLGPFQLLMLGVGSIIGKFKSLS